MSYDRWKTRSPDDELCFGFPYDEPEDEPEEPPEEDEMNQRTEQMLEDRAETIMAAAHALIAMVRGSECTVGGRAEKGELSVEVQLTAGGTETWLITIECTASSH